MTPVWRRASLAIALIATACYRRPTDATCELTCVQSNACPGDLACVAGFCVTAGTPDGACGAPSDAVLDAGPDAPANFLDFCPPGYELEGNGKYKLVETLATWPDAEMACEQDQIEATASFIHTHLAVLTSMTEHGLVGAMTTQAVWVGYTDQGSEGMWHHVNQESAAYPGNGPGPDPVVDPTHPWNNGEPNGSTGEDCAILITTANGRKFDDRGCTNATFRRICECDLRPASAPDQRNTAWSAGMPRASSSL
jgi:hypothetical protein